jgi:TPR repeat protein
MAPLYEVGDGGLAKDDTRAAGWYRKVAEKGDAGGMVTLGYFY